ncbi:unnamed protein product, partial [Laminaria digitata]
MAAVSAVAAVPGAPAPRVGDTLNQAWKNDKTKFGLKMLQKMGWTEGKGLGKREDGVSEHVKVAKKSNNLGLGASHDSTGAAGWASTAVSFNGVLEALGKAYGHPSAKGDSSSSKKRKKSKQRDKKRQNGDDANSSGSSSGEGASASSAQAASSCPSRARRVRSKDVKGFSTADLRAILGQAATTANPSLPSYPVIGGGVGRSRDEASAKKKKSSKKKRSREEMAAVNADPGSSSTQAAPRRPRTRSLDLADSHATDASGVEPAPAAAKRPRTRSMDHAEGEGGGGRGDAGGV